MERIFRYLPPKPRSLGLCLALTVSFVGVCFLVVIGLHGKDGLLGFYILLPAIFLASVLLGRGAGIFATTLSALLLYALVTPSGSVLLPVELILPLVLFVLIALIFALVSDGLRTSMDRAAAAERAKDLLLRELGHRTKNNLTMVVSVLSFQARLKTDPDTKRALEKAIARVHAIASAHEYIQSIERAGGVQMRDYLEGLCSHSVVKLVVSDDGVGCSTDRQPGMGSRLVELLVRQLGGDIAWEAPGVGCRVALVFSQC